MKANLNCCKSGLNTDCAPTGERLRVAYVTTYDASDVSHWSGTGRHMAVALERQNIKLDLIGPLPHSRLLWPLFKTKGIIYNHMLHRRYFAEHDVTMARHYARAVESRFQSNGRADVIFSPGTIPVAFVKAETPIVIWSDATHECLFDFYPEYSGLSSTTARHGHQIEREAIERAGAIIMSSEWAADSAISDYGADPGKVHVVPFGANIEPPPAETVLRSIESRSRRICKLLFIGVDWQRKGGDMALEVAERLNNSGLPTELTIVGCNPFGGQTEPEFVRCEGFLDKMVKEDRQRIMSLLAESHFLIVPSLAECFGIVYCEANALGVPCLARSVGGVPTVIKDGVNGYLFNPGAPPEECARRVERVFRDYYRYIDLARSSLKEYQARLNWDVAGRRVREILLKVRRER